MSAVLKLGTRGSRLALWQTEWVQAALARHGVHAELIVIKTRGDAEVDRPLRELEGKGFFTKEIEDALLAGRIDAAVHSLKDLPTRLPDGLALAAVPSRADPAEALVTRDAGVASIADLPGGAKIGTSSLRRVAQVRYLRPDLEIVALRGNVPTRVQKVTQGRDGLAAALLAVAGLERLELAGRIAARVDPLVDARARAGRPGSRGAERRPWGPCRARAARRRGKRAPRRRRAEPARDPGRRVPGSGGGVRRGSGLGARGSVVWEGHGPRWFGADHGIGGDRRQRSRRRGRCGRGLAHGARRVEIARAMSQFPIRRMRRLRRTAALRRLVQETHLVPSQLVWPLFVCHGSGVRREVALLPGVYQTSVDELVKDAERAQRLGLGGIILFGLPAAKDATGSEAYDEQGVVQQAARAVKRAVPELLVIGDVCLCEYTDHGHCGVIQDGDVDNDASVYLLGKVAVTQARAGIDIVAPSDMMDGRVAGIRKALDAAGLSRVPIMSYAAKTASAFYGPFREAAGSAPQFGDRQSYQMQGGNADEAMKEIRLDVDEGADIILVKPALPCLDLVRRAKQEFGSPLAAYQVSGEYAMIKAAAARGMLDETRAMWETLYAIRRAGADIILSYFAPTAAELL